MIMITGLTYLEIQNGLGRRASHTLKSMRILTESQISCMAQKASGRLQNKDSDMIF